MSFVGIVSGSRSYLLLGVALVIYCLWHAIRQWSGRHVHGREPPLIPYWIPGAGHTFSFLRNIEKTIDNAM
ncbi:hypothetical protein M747DRAFT_119218 [Aspergillus niger ATCC 13496]|uniref:Uncharacterized protein n=2 Tax=Aspergillus niger TaxID=5061 RepID=A0A370BLF7_ASPNG|nr:hypothetical protein M747DRAFT_119218 [Aspergillus niger ATCC 13496]